MSASTITVDKVQPNIATYTTLSSALLQSPIITGGLGLQVIKTADYTILDNDYYSNILVDPSARAINITLPAASSNTNRSIFIKVTTKGGNVTVTGTIDGGNLYLNRQYDYAEVISNGTNWNVKHCLCSYSTGWINTADWTNRHLGSMLITYSSPSGAFVVGETLTESTSNNTWIITADSGTIFTCKEATGTGFATNARTLTGATSGKTATVNGTTKDIDGTVVHGFNTPYQKLQMTFRVSTDGTEANSQIIGIWSEGSYDRGIQAFYVSDNAYTFHTGSVGICNMQNSNGVFAQMQTNDWYYEIYTTYVK